MPDPKKRKLGQLASMFTPSTSSRMEQYVKYCKTLPPSRFVDLDVGDQFYHVNSENQVEVKVVSKVSVWSNKKGKTYFAKKSGTLTDANVMCGEFRSDDIYVFKSEQEAMDYIKKASNSDEDSDEDSDE